MQKIEWNKTIFKLFFKTFGCRTNQFDTQVMIKNIKNYIVVNDEKDADIIVVNSCTVTNGADSGVRHYINQAQRRNPNIKIYLTGCGVLTQGESLFNDKSLNGVFGHSKKEDIENFLDKKERFFEVGDLNHIDSTIVTEFIGKTRAFIKIQEGCDFKCSYCIIPTVRGMARSHSEAQILEQIKILAINGFGEFILTGTNVGSYGKDIKSSLSILIKKISQIRGVRRIRIGSLEPIQIDNSFLELLDEPFMAKHLHIAIQHSSDQMLKYMNRRNRFKDDLELFEKISLHGYAIGTDYIVGFPHESDDIWNEAIQNIKKMPLTHIHAFSYSKRDGTIAAGMKNQVLGNIAKKRHKELTNIIKDKNINFRKNIKPLNILIEKESRIDGYYNYFGYDQFFNNCKIVSKDKFEERWVKSDLYIVEEKFNKIEI